MVEGLQKPDEFYERLGEAFWVYIAFDPKARENQFMVNQMFVLNLTLISAASFRN